jgi:hypothetical protein
MTKACFEAKRREWAEKVRLQKESDPSISIAGWCREHRIDYKAFLYWRKRLEQVPVFSRCSFTELSEAPVTTEITIEYQNVHIRLAKDFDPAILIKCLRAIKEAIC